MSYSRTWNSLGANVQYIDNKIEQSNMNLSPDES